MVTAALGTAARRAERARGRANMIAINLVGEEDARLETSATEEVRFAARSSREIR